MFFRGLRVLDFGSALAAPYVGMFLADLGAEVIKFEKPRRGDLIRFTDSYLNGESGYFAGINRGKRSVTLDLRREAGQAIALQVCASADVVLENFRPGMMDAWGLSYARVAERKRDIIYCSVSGFGDTKGFEARTSNDIVAQAYAGIMAMTGEADGPPAKAGVPLVDVMAASMATVAVISALYRRSQSGEGAHIKTSLIEAAFALMPNFSASVLNGNPTFRRLGSGHPQLAPYEAFRTLDKRYVVVGAFHQESWRRLCEALEMLHLLDDQRFSDNRARVGERDALREIVAGAIGLRSLDEWLHRFELFDVPASPVLEVEEAVSFFVQRNEGLVCDVESWAGSLTMMGAPYTIDGARPSSPLGPPALGDATEEILNEVGISAEEMLALRKNGIV